MAPPHSQRYFPRGTPASCNALYTKPHSHLQKVTEAIFKLGYLISNDGARRSSAAQPLFLVATVFQETAREDPEKLLRGVVLYEAGGKNFQGRNSTNLC